MMVFRQALTWADTILFSYVQPFLCVVLNNGVRL